ncbi:MAG: NfeD family protein [Acidobacteriaceae bacterium]|nr:NfeD family protein [Acidobacteriaceae bacterium]MBV8569509.1 NfeD family protein [Acidobacteriaceae bacterium]
MTWPDIFLLCFAIGVVWSVAMLLLGGLHFGHIHGHSGHAGHVHAHAGHVHGSPAMKGVPAAHHSSPGQKISPSWIGSMLNPSSAAVFLAWFGGVGYVLTRHSGFALLLDLLLALIVGLIGAWFLAAFLRFLQSREKPLDPADYDMVGVLGRVSSVIRANGVGEVIYVRDGVRKPLPARSADQVEIQRGEEVVVTRYEQGIGYVRTWEAMTQPGRVDSRPQTLPGENTHVQ